jgi:hypothetical protein
MANKKHDARFAALLALENNGRLRPDDLIRAARSASHPCHNEFTWDDTQAAIERRHDQARAIIRNFHFEIEVEDIGKVTVVAYVPDQRGEEAFFRNITKVRRPSEVHALFDAEVRQLFGVASRVLAIAQSKVETLGEDRVNTLRGVCRALKLILNN